MRSRLFAPVLDRYDLLVQGTVRIGSNQVFDPDFALLDLDRGQYKTRYPIGADIQLVIESAASSLRKDFEKKLPAYASAEIKEYWVLDLNKEDLHIFRQPKSSSYKQELMLRGEEKVSPLACPDLEFTVASLFA